MAKTYTEPELVGNSSRHPSEVMNAHRPNGNDSRSKSATATGLASPLDTDYSATHNLDDFPFNPFELIKFSNLGSPYYAPHNLPKAEASSYTAQEW